MFFKTFAQKELERKGRDYDDDIRKARRANQPPKGKPMSNLDVFTSLDDTIKAIKETHQREMQECKDNLLSAQIEATMAKNQLQLALADRDKYMRVATKLITQFGTVEAVFAEAKVLALDYAAMTQQKENVTPPPPAPPEDGKTVEHQDPTNANVQGDTVDNALNALKGNQ